MKINFHICRKLNLQPYYVKKIFPYDLYRRVKASVNQYDKNIYCVASIKNFTTENHLIQTNYSYNLESTPTVERPTSYDPDWNEVLHTGNNFYTLTRTETINPNP